MKLYVFARVYSLPILLLISLLIRIQAGATPFQILATSVLVVAAFMLAVLTDKRYVRTFTVGDNRIIITYLTQFLQLRTTELERSAIAEIKLSKRRALSGLWLPLFSVKVDDEWIDFSILTKELYEDIHRHVDSAIQPV
ncbi:MAG TPA: hypothetical protein VD996_11925 [Chitinophagaceae bacterium]|nr:hypothetical protein [Chitinophagaceae bacterium]